MVSSKFQSLCHVFPLVCLYSVKPPLSGESCRPKGKHPGLNTPTWKFSQNEGMQWLVSSLCSLFLSKENLCICACFTDTDTHLPPHPHILPDLPTETLRQLAHRSQSAVWVKALKSPLLIVLDSLRSWRQYVHISFL